MYFSKKSVTGTTEILASNDYDALKQKITEDEAVLAGMPITQAGKAAPAGTNAVGILLYDVDPAKNPNAAIVVRGTIDWGKCKAHNSSITATTSEIAKIFPKITFQENGLTFNSTATA